MENDERWVDTLLAAHAGAAWVEALEPVTGKVRENQRRIKRVEQEIELDVHELKQVARRLTMGEAKARQAKREMIEANCVWSFPLPRNIPIGGWVSLI